ncbi:MAG: alkaline phosphatase family protein, partial [Polyangiaceae bacterium]
MRPLRLVMALAAISAVGCAAMVACGGGNSGDDGETTTSGSDASIGADGSPTLDDGGVLADGAPNFDFPTPIKHVIVIVKENHTFDNFFGELDGGPGAYPVLTAKLHDGTTINRPKCPSGGIDRDFPHDHASTVQAYNKGAMNGLDLNNNTVHASGGANDYEAYCTFGPINQTTLYWQLARNYATADHYFSNMLGPSFPGHLASAIGKSPAFANPGCPANDQSCET